jgi:hypothetical protein
MWGPLQLIALPIFFSRALFRRILTSAGFSFTFFSRFTGGCGKLGVASKIAVVDVTLGGA